MSIKMKKVCFLCIGLSLMLVIGGCSDSKKTAEEAGTDREESEALEETQPSEEPIQETLFPQTNIEYGDKINIMCSKTIQEFQWEYTGTQEFQVATTSVQFQNEFDDSEEAAMKQVEKAIGKMVGDTFTLWYEGGDGLYGYEYTIVDVKSQNPNRAEYGDKILADYSMTHYGVDTCEGEEIHTGQQTLHLLNTNAFFAYDGDEVYSTRAGDSVLKNILGKTIGDQFKGGNSYCEKSFHYRFTIREINKAVKYGDTIVAEVREANTLDAKRYEEHFEEEWVLDLEAMTGLHSLDGEYLSLENIRALYRELIGKKAGDRVFYVREDREKRELYDIMIRGIEACEREYVKDGMEVLIMARDADIIKFYQYFAEYEDRFFDNSGTYSEPILCSLVINNREEKMVYEYYNTHVKEAFYVLNDSYVYMDEYDENGRLVKETIRGSNRMSDGIIEYKYDEQGRCIESIQYSLDYTSEIHLYFDDMGKLIKSEHISDDYTQWDEYVYEGDSLVKSIHYYEDGIIWVSEYNEWGGMISDERIN